MFTGIILVRLLSINAIMQKKHSTKREPIVTYEAPVWNKTGANNRKLLQRTEHLYNTEPGNRTPLFEITPTQHDRHIHGVGVYRQNHECPFLPMHMKQQHCYLGRHWRESAWLADQLLLNCILEEDAHLWKKTKKW